MSVAVNLLYRDGMKFVDWQRWIGAIITFAEFNQGQIKRWSVEKQVGRNWRSPFLWRATVIGRIGMSVVDRCYQHKCY